MYLKRIELQGFKSFAVKTKFEFHNGITGIVGPNGSGKSNVADAVRWVLGEQRAKQLRGSNMQDVIFAGTENRKPLSYAYVAITLDNSDHALPTEYTEVTVARRIYRSGESEYLINGVSCRLKDVQELFYDTGIGKEGYSIIGQGQIERIVSGKPEERRELFDEAAGIVKYKRRKATAQKKLENQQDNLLRVNDIIGELEKQVGPLQKQSETAHVYLQKKETLKSLDIRYFLQQSDKLNEQLKETKEKQEILEKDQAVASAEYEKLKEDSAQMEADMQAIEEQIAALTKRQNDNGLTKNNYQHQIALLQEQIRAADVNDEHLKTRAGALDEELALRQKDLTRYQAQLEEQMTLLEEVTQEKNSAQKELETLTKNIVSMQEHIDSGKAQILELLQKKATIQADRQHFETLIEQIHVQETELQERKSHLEMDAGKLAELCDFQVKAFEEASKTLASLTGQRDAAEQVLQDYAKQRETLNEKLQSVNRTQIQEQSRLESLQNIAERYEGYGESTRRVMEQKDYEPGILGVVAEIIHVKDKYETAMETALGGNIRNIVTEDEATAKRMIEFLKKKRYGRATFLPLTSVKPRKAEKEREALSEPGVLGLACDLVDYDTKYENVVSQLLGQILIVDTIDHALPIAKKHHYSLRLVTLQGEYLQPGGSLTGGAFKNNSNLLGRQREMEEISSHLEKLAIERSAFEADFVRLQETRNAKRAEIAEIQEQIKTQELTLNMAKAKAERAKNDYRERQVALDKVALQQEEFEERIAKIQEQSGQITQEVETSETRSNEIASENAVLVTRLSEARARRQTLDEQTTEMARKEAAELQKRDFIQENISRLSNEMEKLTGEKESMLSLVASAKGEVETKQAEIQRLTDEIARLEKESIDDITLHKEALEKKETMNRDFKGFFEKREELTRQMGDFDKESYRLKQQEEISQNQLEQQNAYMWEEYELTYHNAEKLVDWEEEALSPTELRKQTKEIRNQIRDLGPVNVNAIEEYREVSERFEFLTTQRDDIEKAKENLLQIINDLDRGMRKQFNEQFGMIQKEFQKVFTTLFGGGHGSLDLVEGEDLLEAGIEINAQPPGKKLQNMMQMSGGEKSLTAICLLFAIQNLKPSPFCLLDEIEAALDEPNVDRFAKYLGKLSRNTQFIVITHRRGSMTAADRLYGITMQEKGVSAQVSVNLVEDSLVTGNA